MDRVYVASRASVPERPAMWQALRSRGANIVSSWIDESGEGDTACFTELWTRIEREIVSADRLVLYAESSDFPLKGALVEVGMAIALGKPVFIVSPDVTVDVRNMKPIGSWAKHPCVVFCDDIELAVGLKSKIKQVDIFHDGLIPPPKFVEIDDLVAKWERDDGMREAIANARSELKNGSVSV